MFKSFTLPLSDSDLEQLSGVKTRHCLVGVFSGTAGSGARDLSGGQLVRRLAGGQLRADQGASGSRVDLYVHEQKKLAVVHVVGVNDLEVLASLAEQGDIGPQYKQQQFKHANMVLFLLHVVHLAIFVQVGVSLSARNVRWFRILDQVRQGLAPTLISAVNPSGKDNSVHVSDAWLRSGARFCTPRLLVCCLCTPKLTRELDNSNPGDPASQRERRVFFKKLYTSLENEIYNVLRRNWVLQDYSANSLFTVPAKKSFVYILQMQSSQDPTGFFLQRLTAPHAQPADSISGGQDAVSLLYSDHIEPLVRGRPFNDNINKYSGNDTNFEFPTLAQWAAFANRLHHVLVMKETAVKPLESLRSQLDTEHKFSDNRCSKALPLAMRVYQDGLPNHYTTDKHNLHLQNAIAYFSNFARGKCFDKYLQELRENCERYWSSGHQLCEVMSLTNHHCVYPFHFTSEQEKVASCSNQGAMVKPHCSKLRSTSGCNCGRRQGVRDDPFTLHDANVLFYSDMDKKCCHSCDRIPFPTQPSVAGDSLIIPSAQSEAANQKPVTSPPPGAAAAVSDWRRGEADPEVSSQVESVASVAEKKLPQFFEDLSLSEVMELGQHSESNQGHPFKFPAAEKPTAPPEQVLEPPPVACDLPMLSSECPAGFLPKHNTWSLLKVSNHGGYDPQNGLDLPGFIHGTNFLLPFDTLTVSRTAEEPWPSLDPALRPPLDPAPRLPKPKAQPGFKPAVARAYVGFEFECFKGTRFFLANRDNMVKGPPTGQDVALRALKTDVPLYHVCSCRVNKNSHFSQLTRIHFIAPPSTCLTLHPVVKPLGHDGPAFFPQVDPIPLPCDSHLVLRLPFIYESSLGPHPPPKDPQTASMSFLQHGMVGGPSFIVT